MKTITMRVSDEFASWLESIADQPLTLEGVGFQIEGVQRGQLGGLSCVAIFQAVQQRESGSGVRETIRRQDEAFSDSLQRVPQVGEQHA